MDNDELKKMQEDWNKMDKEYHPHDHICPNCGYCPHCGRPYRTYYPYPWYDTYHPFYYGPTC